MPRVSRRGKTRIQCKPRENRNSASSAGNTEASRVTGEKREAQQNRQLVPARYGKTRLTLVSFVHVHCTILKS